MKAEGRLGGRTQLTSTPSTGVPRSSAGDAGAAGTAGATGMVLMGPNLVQATDSPRSRHAGRGDEAQGAAPFASGIGRSADPCWVASTHEWRPLAGRPD